MIPAAMALVMATLACPEPEEGHARAGVPAPDLTCIPLLPAEAAPGASGHAQLLPGKTPFGVSVDRNGTAVQRFVVEAEGLPEPSELGPYDRFVAWITPPSLTPMIRLGEVRSGRNELAAAGFNAFLLLVSAEGPDVGEERSGPLVLRGTSPAMVLRPHDLPYILAEMAAPPGPGTERDAPPGDVHAGHAGHGPALRVDLPEGEIEWRPPPMHPEVRMPEAMMRLRPAVSPFLPLPEGPLDAVPDARPRESLFLADGDTLVLEAGPVLRRVGPLRVPGYGYNGQIPGPLIEADEGSTVHVRFRNRTPLPTTVHWHGIRLEAPFDGVPGLTQPAVDPGEDFLYRIRLPDEGTFWYHPHLREDVLQDMGLAGNLKVRPADGGTYAPVDREAVLLLDDHLVGPEGPVPYGREAPIHALMGRFGNVLLVNGSTEWALEAGPGEVVRLHLANAAASRTFNLSIGGLPLKLVGSDLGALPEEAWVESVVLAPAERWVIDVRLPDAPGRVPLENRVQALDHMDARFFPVVDTLGWIVVEGPAPAGDTDRTPTTAAFEELRTRPALVREVDRAMDEHGARPPDRTLILDLRVGELPFPLDPLLRWEGVFRPRVEWEGTMPDMDWLATGAAVEWLLVDAETGRENAEIDWRFRQGERVKLRLINDRDSMHPMQHPIHLHGQRFLVLSVDGEPNPYPAWKDTVLVPVGSVVDLLIEMGNPGPWMLHCHISEHLETGMMTILHVEPEAPEGETR